MSIVLDAGALVALERNDRAIWLRLWACRARAESPVTHGGVVGQVWRGRGPRHALLAKALRSIHVIALDDALGRRAGELLGLSGTRDVIDAALVLLATDGDLIFTSDPDDLDFLAELADRDIELIPV